MLQLVAITLRNYGNINDGKESNTLESHTDGIYSVAFSHDSKMLATGSGDGTTKLWNINDRKKLQSETVKRYMPIA